MSPLVGIRYNCKVCNDFDVCEKCYKDRVHHHTKYEKIGKNG